MAPTYRRPRTSNTTRRPRKTRAPWRVAISAPASCGHAARLQHRWMCNDRAIVVDRRDRRSSQSCHICEDLRMRGVVLLLLALAVLVTQYCLVDAHSIPYGSACGVERWSIKTLMDAGARSLPTTPKDTSIAHLVSFKAPANPDAGVGRVPGMETSMWRVRAELVGYRIEEDSDYHLVLRDPQTSQEMVAEIPAPYRALRRRRGRRSPPLVMLSMRSGITPRQGGFGGLTTAELGRLLCLSLATDSSTNCTT